MFDDYMAIKNIRYKLLIIQKVMHSLQMVPYTYAPIV